MKKMFLNEEIEKYYENLRKIGLMDDKKPEEPVEEEQTEATEEPVEEEKKPKKSKKAVDE